MGKVRLIPKISNLQICRLDISIGWTCAWILVTMQIWGWYGTFTYIDKRKSFILFFEVRLSGHKLSVIVTSGTYDNRIYIFLLNNMQNALKENVSQISDATGIFGIQWQLISQPNGELFVCTKCAIIFW